KDNQRHDFQIVGSGGDDDVIPLYEKYIVELSKPNGLLDRLTIRRTKQAVEFLAGQDLNALAKAGLPVRHYLDGANLASAYNDRKSLIFEVVYPGPQIQHGFYRDDNPFQMVIHLLNHVVGHNNFAYTSFFPHYRAAHVIDEQLKLDKLLEELYTEYDKDEVQRFFLFMQTLLPLQDFYSAYYQMPEEFKPKTPENANPNYKKQILSGQKPKTRHPKSPTENVLSAFIANLPEHSHPWMKDVATHMAKMAGFQPALVHTQVMNEGWATFMEALIIKHMEDYHNVNYWIQELKFSHHGEAPNTTDPYWMGVETWQIIYRRFMNGEEILGKTIQDYLVRPYIAELPSDMEKRDAAFIRFADEELISKKDDRQFLKIGIDNTWVQNKNLAIVRVHPNPNEAKSRLPNPPPGQDVVPWEILTRDKDRIILQLQNTVTNKFRFRPRIQLRDFTRNGSGEVELVIDDDIGNAVPLEDKSVAPSLYALSQIIKKPVSIECMIKDPNWKKPDPGPWWEFDDDFEEDFFSQPKLASLVRARVVVAPNGNIQVYRLEKDSQNRMRERPFKEAQALYEVLLDMYLLDLYLEDEVDLDELFDNNPRLFRYSQQMSMEISNDAPIEGLFDHAPTVASAIIEYNAMLKRRMLKALERGMNGNGGLKRGPNGIMLKALPSIVTFSFDRNYLKDLQKEAVGTNLHFIGKTASGIITTQRQEFKDDSFEIDKKRVTHQGLIIAKNPFDGDEASHGGLHPIEGEPGDPVWGPNPNGGEGEGQPRDPGEDANDPSWVPLPKDLYAKFLGDKVKLPNLNPKPGKTKKTKKVQKGHRNQKTGVAISTEILINALKKGQGALDLEDRELEDDDLLDAIEAGFVIMNPERDWVVKSYQEVPAPEINAVVNFVLDGSGSAWSHYPTYKRFVYDMKLLIESNYKNIKFNFIVFDGEAHRAKDETEFFKMEFGGGTSYVKGMEMIKKIHEEEFPHNQWDRFTFILGDLEDWDEKIAPTLDELIDESEFVGLIRGTDFDYRATGRFDFTGHAMQLHQNNKYFGFLDLGPRKDYNIDDLRLLLKNDAE
ncbi:MAG: SpoVR family protein, partial [Bdellovibrionales bacterium]|nr:SpoVR family protein [Bdellovibrionales bacterium]